MTFKTNQKVIKIGSSKGATLPAKQLKSLGVEVGDEVELIVRKVTTTTDNQAIAAAKSILMRYETDFKNLAQR